MPKRSINQFFLNNLNEISAIDIEFKDALLASDPRTWAHSQFPVKIHPMRLNR
jgi:hypothetical protein